ASMQLLSLRPGLTLRGGLTYAFIRDTFGREAEGEAHQQLHRLGLGLALHLGPPPAAPAPVAATPVPEAPEAEAPKTVLTLRVSARGEEGAPLTSAVARVGEETFEADEAGHIVLEALGAGMHAFEVSAPGYRSVSEVVEL